jgi:hypothetical protein
MVEKITFYSKRMENLVKPQFWGCGEQRSITKVRSRSAGSIEDAVKMMRPAPEDSITKGLTKLSRGNLVFDEVIGGAETEGEVSGKRALVGGEDDDGNLIAGDGFDGAKASMAAQFGQAEVEKYNFNTGLGEPGHGIKDGFGPFDMDLVGVIRLISEPELDERCCLLIVLDQQDADGGARDRGQLLTGIRRRELRG